MEFVVKLLGANRKKVAGTLAASLLLLLTACTPINSAATIGKTSISVDKVQKTVDSILAERAKVSTTGMNLETGEALNRSQVTFFVVSELLYQLGKRNKLVISEQEITDQVKAVTAQVGGEANLPSAEVHAGISPENLREYFRTYLISTKISNALIAGGIAKTDVTSAVQKLVSDEASRLKVSINPRYGSWSADQATIIAAPLASGAVTK